MTSPDVTAFRWNPARERAAELLAQDKQSDETIASEVGVTRRQLARWKLIPAFRERVESRAAEALAELRAKGLLERVNRLEALRDVADRIHRVMSERGESELMAEVAGGRTGLLVAKPVLVRVYEADEAMGDVLIPVKQSRIAYEYAVDTGTLRELRETMKQAAQELGEWSEKHEVGGKGGGPIGLRHTVGPDQPDDFDFGAFAAGFVAVASGAGAPGGAALAGAGDPEPLDTAHALHEAGDLPDGADA